jgi:hypothetical protein
MDDGKKQFKRQQTIMSRLVAAFEQGNSSYLHTYKLHKSTGYMGYGLSIYTEDVQPSLPEHYLVYPFLEVKTGSPATRAGMRNGQRLVAVDGLFVNKDLTSVNDIVRVIEDGYLTRECSQLTVISLDLWLQCMEKPGLASELTFSNGLDDNAVNKGSSPSNIDSLRKINRLFKNTSISDERLLYDCDRRVRIDI